MRRVLANCGAEMLEVVAPAPCQPCRHLTPPHLPGAPCIELRWKSGKWVVNGSEPSGEE